jgi:hypothetical protein
LISTGVTAASYTSASITVDADGRITAASSGSAGAGMGIPTRYSVGPTSGTHTAAPTANRIGVYLSAGGGGGGNNSTPMEGVFNSGGAGGGGGFGFINKPITQPFSQPFSVGAGGGISTAGGATNFTNVGSANAGNGGASAGGSPAAPGNAGTITGATLTYPQRGFVVGFSAGVGGNPGGGSGTPGVIVVFENTGT